jgi:hypothetical protein
MRPLFGAVRKPAHIAVLSGSEEFTEALARLRREFRSAEAHGIEAECKRAIADQWPRIA